MRKAIIVALVLLLACDSPVEPKGGTEVFGIERISPRDQWEALYEEMGRCVGQEGEFSRVNWFRADSIKSNTRDRIAGAWLTFVGRPHGIAIHRVRLSRGGERLANTIQHESIHEILQNGDHSDPVWCRCAPEPERIDHC